MRLDVDRTFNFKFTVQEEKKTGFTFSIRANKEQEAEIEKVLNDYLDTPNDFTSTAIALVAIENELKDRNIPTRITYFTQNKLRTQYFLVRSLFVALRLIYRTYGSARYHEMYKLNQ